MSTPSPIAAFLAKHTRQLLTTTARAIEDLSSEELHFRAHAGMNSIGFEAWHVARTADNLVHFAFEREQPVWLQQGLDKAWNLPKADQGTGMEAATAHELRFPEAKLLAQYSRDVAAAVAPRIEAMSDEYLAAPILVRPLGEMPRADAIGNIIIIHGNNHIGQLNLARTLQGKPGLGF